MSHEQITAKEAAALLLSICERAGAVVTVNEDDLFHIDLDPCRARLDDEKARQVMSAIFALSDEIRAELIARRVIH